MITRSLFALLIQLAYQVDVPQAHAVNGNTVSTIEPSRHLGTELGKLIDIKYSSSKPEHTFAAVQYRDLWFWVDDRDFKSKRTFLFVMILFSLLETGGTEALPQITIPVL